MTESEKSTSRITQLEEKLFRQSEALASYRDQLKKLTDYKSERDLYLELTSIFALSTDVDDLITRTLEALSGHLKARYYGVFWLDPKGTQFVFRHGRGYKPGLMSAIPHAGSLMGECLYKREVLWEPQLSRRTAIIPLNQDPAEYNVLCAPLVLMGNDAGVVRLANIDPAISAAAVPILQTVARLTCSSLERLMLQGRNEWTMRGLEASFSIARLLENTLSKQDILRKVCAEIPRLFSCSGCVLAMRDATGTMRAVLCWPESFALAGNPNSMAIYLRNLLEAYPGGSALIPSIASSEGRRWSWPEARIRSLVMAPIRIRNVVQGVIVVAGPPEETYEKAQMNLLGIVAAQTAMTLERASYFQQQEDLARCDGLTGLFNHRMFQEILREEILREQRYGRSLALIMLDVDHFKKFNDTYGHPVGDEVLKMVSRTLRGVSRSTDRCFRYGGEEFAVLLPETPGENAVVLAERLRRQVEENRTVRNLNVTVSCGIAGLQADDSPESFVKRADTALYAAKQAGRNRVAIG